MHTTLHNARELDPELIEVWRVTVRTVPSLDHPLLHPAWTILAARDLDVEVGVLWQGGEAVGFFPFERQGRCAGRPVVACMTDFHGLVARPQLACDLKELMRGCNLSAWHFDHVPLEQRWFWPHTIRVEEAPVIDLVDGFEPFWQKRRLQAPSWTKQVERKRRKLAREVGPLRFVWHTLDEPVLDALATWKRRQIQAVHGFDVFRTPWMKSFLHSVAAHQEEGFAGVLSALYAGPELVAIHLGIRNRHLMSSWIPTYNAQVARYSPGAVLHFELARAAVEQGLAQIELGRGHNPWKLAIASSSRKLAIGVVDFRPAWKWCRERRVQFRELVAAAPFGRMVRTTYRRVRNAAATFPLLYR